MRERRERGGSGERGGSEEAALGRGIEERVHPPRVCPQVLLVTSLLS